MALFGGKKDKEKEPEESKESFVYLLWIKFSAQDLPHGS
jgi:hypothetical protein